MPPKIDDDLKRVHIMTPVSLLQQVDDWRRHQPDVPNLSAAIRRLIEMGLEAAKKGGKGK